MKVFITFLVFIPITHIYLQAQAPNPPQAPEIYQVKPTESTSYDIMRVRAIGTNKPLVIGVGCDVPEDDWLVCRVDMLEGYTSPCIVISRPKGNDLYWIATLSCHSKVSDIRAALVIRIAGEYTSPVQTNAARLSYKSC